MKTPSMKTPRKAFLSPIFYLGAPFNTGYKDPSRWENESSERVKIEDILESLKGLFILDKEQINQLFSELPREKPYDVFCLGLDLYRGTENMKFSRIEDPEIIVFFDTYYDKTADDIFIRGKKIFKEGKAWENDYKEPSWLNEAYAIATKNSIYFQDNQYGTHHLLPVNRLGFFFHSGYNTIKNDLGLIGKIIPSIKNAEKSLSKIVSPIP